MRKKRTISRAHREKGQTIVLVALSIVTLLAMAALAIDVVTLYVARSEAQRAADAAALAGAKAFADSGVTTDPTNPALQTLAQNMATAAITAIVQQNKMGGTPPVLASPPSFNFAQQGDPQVTVTLQRTDLPTFFARLQGRRLAAVSASATAEAYNPSNSQTITGNFVPIAPKCVKPLLVPNLDPNTGAPFITVATGVVAPGVVGEGPFTLSDACKPGIATCGPPVTAPTAGQYLPAKTVPDPTKELCPSCKGASDFEQSIECCDFNRYSCGAPLPTTVDTTGGPIPTSADLTISGTNSHQDAHYGVQCLIHEPGQDTLDTTNFLSNSGPMQITAGSGPLSGKLVTTSSSIATLPIFDTASLNTATGQVTVVGFLQVFISGVTGNGTITATILNVVGCGNSPGTATPISGGGVSPIPVRLIHN